MSHSDFFDQIAEAAKAMQELPAAKDKINALHHELDIAHERIANKTDRIMELAEQVEQLQASLKQAREDRDNASFRELEASDRLENLLKAIQGASSLREPEPPKPIEPEGEAPISDAFTEAQQPGEVTQPQADPMTATPILQSSQSETVNYTGEASASSSEPAPSPFAELTAEGSSPVSSSGTTGVETGKEVHGGESLVGTPESASPKPYWLKEPWMTWKEWAEKGGVIPSWVHDRAST